MTRIDLAMEYFELRRQKRALADEFKARMEPVCSRIKEIEELLEGCGDCRSCGTQPARPTLRLVSDGEGGH